MLIKSLSPSNRTAPRTQPLQKCRLRLLHRSGVSNDSSRSPRNKRQNILINQSSDSNKQLRFMPKIESAVEHLQNKLRGSRSYHLMKQQSSHVSYTPHIQNISTHTTQPTLPTSQTPTSARRDFFLFPTSKPSNRQHLPQFFRKRAEGGDINNRISNLKQGIDKCLKQLELRRFQVLRKLGSGVNGQVVLARIRNLSFVVALKTVKKTQAQMHSRCFLQEIKIQAFLDHPNIIKLYGLTSDQQNIYMILEVSSHNLFREIRQERGFTEDKAKGYIKQVLNALIFLHSFNIIHRDVKPENILCCHGVLKLCDFGWSIYKGQNGMRKTFCGTYDYVSPQVSQGCLYDEQIDAWSVGILTFEMLTCTVPFKQKLIIQFEQIHFPQKFSRSVKDFISRLLVYDPKKRMTVQEAMHHSWLADDAESDGTMSFEEIQLLNFDEE